MNKEWTATLLQWTRVDGGSACLTGQTENTTHVYDVSSEGNF